MDRGFTCRSARVVDLKADELVPRKRWSTLSLRQSRRNGNHVGAGLHEIIVSWSAVEFIEACAGCVCVGVINVIYRLCWAGVLAGRLAAH